MATLKDVAKLACVDVSTVSRALNNTSYVHPDTKARIFAAVKELSYQPNVLAQGLRQGKRHTIGVVVPRLQFTVFGEIVKSIEQTAQKLGYATLISTTEESAKVERETLSRLRNGFVDGIILAGTGANGRLVRDIKSSGLPVAQVVRRQERDISSVVADYEACAHDGTMFLADKGCMEIGLINGSMDIAPYLARYKGYKKALPPVPIPGTALNTATSAPGSCWTKIQSWMPSWRRWTCRVWAPCGPLRSVACGCRRIFGWSASPGTRWAVCWRRP